MPISNATTGSGKLIEVGSLSSRLLNDLLDPVFKTPWVQ